MYSSSDTSSISIVRRRLAFGVHLFTASGVLWGFLALICAVNKDWRGMFAWLAVALFVDGIDGTIARKIGVTSAAPRWSGEVLDLIIDYLTYVIVPAYALYASGLLTGAFNFIGVAVILGTSAFYFADNEMKTEDAWFKGFPAVWNLIIFYFFLLDPGQWVTFITILVLGAMTFAPFVFVHPLRVAKLRNLTLSLLMVWSLLAMYAIWQNMEPQRWIIWALSLIGVYFLILGYFRTVPARGR